MLNRQKVLLSMLELADRPVGRIELMKWAFYVRQVSPSKGGDSFYDFLPYHFGPFSFALYQEVGKLEEQGYVTSSDENHWTLGPMNPTKPPKDVDADARNAVKTLSHLSVDNLLDQIYARFPYFTMNSKRQRLVERPEGRQEIYTSGYEGLSIDAFLNRLIENGIKRLIDVRRNPIARRYGFHKSTLKRLTETLGIDYVHFPELGISSELRQSLDTQDDYDRLFARYNLTTLVDEKHAIQSATTLCKDIPSVLVCMEAEPCCCHRSHLAQRIAVDSKLPVSHLT
ncbi:MAG: DUF488 domain-containing protein [Pirellula sp.]|nr:DUF488 domain-containing protein [Pirellula sp.]